MATTSPEEALEALQQLRQKRQQVALFLSDQRMPEMNGTAFLEEAKDFFPEARTVLLTAYSDTEVAIEAINQVKLDHYLLKPWDPPEEQLFPVLDDLLYAWREVSRPDTEGLQVVGYQFAPASHQIKDFLGGNLIPYTWLDAEKSPQAQQVMAQYNLEPHSLPAVVTEAGEVLKQPEPRELAEAIGMEPKAQEALYDVVVIGAGPAGLAAAVYGSSEGLKTLLIEKHAPGGQAGTSTRIENYLGFPQGLSGKELAKRALDQAKRFGTEVLTPQEVEEIELRGSYKLLRLADGTQVRARSLVIATGVEYQKLEAPGVNELAGAGIYYGSAMTEAAACMEKDVYVVGGGNSAGQAAVYLSKYARRVFILNRDSDLSHSMSSYLIDQIDDTETVEVCEHTEVAEALGTEHLEQLTLLNNETKKQYQVEAGALFIFIGARPHTDWLGIPMFKDEEGYLLTGHAVMEQEQFENIWKLERDPYLLETCTPGIFTAGDVRAGAMNRVAAAVGDGSMAIKFVHEYLMEM